MFSIRVSAFWAGALSVATMPEVALVLTEDLVGLRNQALGLAERAGLAVDCRTLAPRGVWQHLPARFWPDPLATAGVDLAAAPRLMIGCGGKSAAVGAALRARGHVAVQVQNPRLDPRRFDLVIVQPHDRLTGRNVMVTRTALHRVTPEALQAARVVWAPRFAGLGGYLISVLIGGGNGRLRFDAATARELGQSLVEMARAAGAGIALTPSRRTTPEALAALRATLAGRPDVFFWDGDGENPYLGLLACADTVVVTGDSVSMISEAAATDAPVLVAGLPGTSRRIGAFTDALLANGRIRRYAGRLENWNAAALDDTPRAAAALRACLERAGGASDGIEPC